MKKLFLLLTILSLHCAAALAQQVKGTQEAINFIRGEFFPTLNKWSVESQKDGNSSIAAERNLMKVLSVTKVDGNYDIDDELTRANTNKTGWYGFFKDRTLQEMPFECTFISADLKKADGINMWFYVTYRVDYADKTDWSNMEHYNPNSSLFVRKSVTVHDYMLVLNSTKYPIVDAVSSSLPGGGAEPSVPHDSPSPVAVERSSQTIYANGVPIEMIAVQGGTFRMGATSEQGSDAWSNEKPVHSVTLSSYQIGKYEVTQKLWKAVMGSNPEDMGDLDSEFFGDNLPVVRVSWDEIQTFITKLNQITGKRFRLPTEAEWEYAARGGNSSRGYKYSGSNNISDVAWYDGNSGSKPHAVGGKSPNELGIYDMTGNVWEWCQDAWDSDYYSKSPSSNPECKGDSGFGRVYRGGSWGSIARYCRVSYRDYFGPGGRGNRIGFRLAL